MKIIERQIGDVTVLDLHGKLTNGDDDILRNAVSKSVSASQTNVILNLTDVPYAASSGFGAILDAHRECVHKDGRLAVFGLASNVGEMLRLTGLAHIVLVRETEEEAIRSFART